MLVDRFARHRFVLYVLCTIYALGACFLLIYRGSHLKLDLPTPFQSSDGVLWDGFYAFVESFWIFNGFFALFWSFVSDTSTLILQAWDIPAIIFFLGLVGGAIGPCSILYHHHIIQFLLLFWLHAGMSVLAGLI